MSNIVKYGSYTPEVKEREAEEAAGQKTPYMKLKEGKNNFRVLPPQLGKSSPFVMVHQHYIKVPGRERPVVFACPERHTRGARSCPACAYARKKEESGNKKAARDFFPSKRYFCNVQDLSDDEVKVLAFGKKIKDQLDMIYDASGDYTNPMSGRDILVQRTGTGMTTTQYNTMAMGDRQLDNIDELMDSTHDIDRYARILSEEEIRKLMTGDDEDEDDDDEEEVKQLPDGIEDDDLIDVD